MIKAKSDQQSQELQEELELIKAIALRDERALERLYEIYARRLHRFLFRMVGHRNHGIEEIINEVMFVVWQKASTFDGRSKLSTWIFGIAVRIARKFLSQRGIDSSESGEVAEHESENSWQQRLEHQDSLEKALATLSAEHRAVVELTYFQGLYYREVAVIMDCPENTVKTRMFHARAKLREALESASQ